MESAPDHAEVVNNCRSGQGEAETNTGSMEIMDCESLIDLCQGESKRRRDETSVEKENPYCKRNKSEIPSQKETPVLARKDQGPITEREEKHSAGSDQKCIDLEELDESEPTRGESDVTGNAALDILVKVRPVSSEENSNTCSCDLKLILIYVFSNATQTT